ncbi:MAG: hypothetical protein HQ582_09755 [Planctomycetes bacterium]|nr:hypothetical protein [Planctomycetota bacterium]
MVDQASNGDGGRIVGDDGNSYHFLSAAVRQHPVDDTLVGKRVLFNLEANEAVVVEVK